MNYWLIKSEPFKYSFEQLLKDKKATWDGVRNYAARLNLMAMKKGDLLLFYHSNEGKAVVGIAKVVKEHYPDPTATEGNWVVVDVAPVKALKNQVTLEVVKKDNRLTQMALVKLQRLSVQPVKAEEFDIIMALAGE
jgi:predicted RNA-binding protein with PUA-like domain